MRDHPQHVVDSTAKEVRGPRDLGARAETAAISGRGQLSRPDALRPLGIVPPVHGIRSHPLRRQGNHPLRQHIHRHPLTTAAPPHPDPRTNDE